MTACAKQLRRYGSKTGTKPQRCAWRKCRKEFTPTREGQKYHSPNCAKAAWQAGEATARQKTLTDLGPATPLISEDREAVWRRCLEAARAEVTQKDMVERFRHPGMVDEAIAQARKEGFRQPFKGRGLGSSLAWLPAGMPV